MKSSLTKLEMDIMDIIWRKDDISTAEIKYYMEDSHGIARETVKMYVRRLVEKKMIGVRKISTRNHRYFALMTKEEYEAFELDKYLINNKKGLKHLVASMIRTNEFTDYEISEVEQIIQQYKTKDE
jgi:predicted transcriptional regulator